MQTQSSQITFDGFSILVADDEQDLREMIAETLELYGAKIVQAENGQQAVELMNKEKIDLVISDIRMPGGDGILFLNEVRKKDPQLPPFIFISGFSDFSEKEAFAKGAQAYFHKPFDMNKFIEKIFGLCKSAIK